MVQEHLDERILHDEISKKTANEYRSILHTLFEYAIKKKHFVAEDPQYPNPIKGVDRYKTQPGAIRFLTLPQVREQLVALRPWPQIRAMAATYIYAGLRRSEGLWLTVGESRAKELIGKGEASRIAQTGLSEAAVFLQKIRAYGDPRLFALNLVGKEFAQSRQPLVPERLLMMGGGTSDGKNGDGGAAGQLGVFGQLITLLLAEKAGLDITSKPGDLKELEEYASELTRKVRASGRARSGPNGPRKPKKKAAAAGPVCRER
jgi:hypothetical protein